MIQDVEANLIVKDSKGNPVAMWRRHPKLRVPVLYRLKEMNIADIEKFGPEIYAPETLSTLVKREGNEALKVISKKD